ncbi:hypothetical protein V5799_012925 [Amblyomma americanum]|uniref:Carboxylesterase type B domain-containing protein n=1 Tax=Amblyomma americanum TaxID=6943 RepID=A0AAQ4E7A4_AMBAM
MVTLFGLFLVTSSMAVVYIVLRYADSSVFAGTPISQFTCAYDEAQLSVELKTLDVTVRGHFIYEGRIRTFFGIPYGADTGGKERFRLPKARREFGEGGVFNASRHGPRCPQVNDGRYNFQAEPPFISKPKNTPGY